MSPQKIDCHTVGAHEGYCMLLCRVALKLLQQDASELLRRACVIALEARPHLMPGIFILLE